MRKRTGGRPLIVLDLRQESHGFVDGTAVSWFGARDAANSGKSSDQISMDESALLAGLAGRPTVTVQKVTGKTEDREVGETKPVELPGRSVQSEDEVVHAADGG